MFEFKKEIVTERFKNDKRDFNQYLEDIEINIIKHEKNFLEFDLINVDCSIANALRRIIIAEVPSMAIEYVTFFKYNGVLPEEILSHRLGLVPLFVDARSFTAFKDEHTEFNSIKFSLKIQNDNDEHLEVLSDNFQWIPFGKQMEWLHSHPQLKAGIPITKLAKGQKIDLEVVCVKNNGKEHAKWSPVCTASYRLFPQIKIENVFGDDAIKLQKCFPKGVIDIVKCPNNSLPMAILKNPRLDLATREVLRHKEFEGKVFIGKVHNHFIFSIETVFDDPINIVEEALNILSKKCQNIQNEIDKLQEPED